MPDGDVARIERMVSTFVLGYAISETGARFAAGDPRELRALLKGTDHHAHRRLATSLESKVSAEAEFEADVDDLIRLVESIGRQPGPGRAAAAK